MLASDEPRFRPEAIRELMRRDGMTASEFARRIGVSRQLVSAWLIGMTQPQFATVLRLCRLFNVAAEFFAEGLPERSKGSKRKVTP